MNDWSWQIDGWIVLIGAVGAASAALLGNFLVLRRMSLIGDAISHAVLPGLAGAFLLTGERQGPWMFIGAAGVGVLTVVLTEFARNYGKVDEGAAIGVVFTFLFAVGLIMIVRAADRVDLDPGCVLYGALETTILDQVSVFGIWMPRVLLPMCLTLLVNSLFVYFLYRQLKVSTFDPQLATAQGVPVNFLHYLLAACVAVTSVASFESVGNILVVAMFVVPPVTAWLLTDRLHVMIWLSLLFGVMAAIFGHAGAIAIPRAFGYHSTNTAGMMAVASGILLSVTLLLAPRKGIISRALRNLRASVQILSEDVLATLFRAEQAGRSTMPRDEVRKSLLVSRLRAKIVLFYLRWQGLVLVNRSEVTLAEKGRKQAQNIVRSHRLWEQYLLSEVGIPEDMLHGGAEQLEHFTNQALRERLLAEMNQPAVDPHGSPIPPEAN